MQGLNMERKKQWLLIVTLTSSFFAATLGCQFHPVGDYLRFVRVPENVPVGGEILRVQVQPKGLLSIQPMDKEEDAHYFKVASVNGSWVRVALAKSLEELVDSDLPQSVLKFRLACLDPIDETVSSSYLSVTVYVEDVNDHAPTFLGTPYQVTVDELTPAGLTIFRGIHAIDRDKPNTPNSDVQYSLLASGDDHGHFALESSHRAALVLKSPLDFDAGDVEFNLTVVASDRGTPPNNATTIVQVRVKDNDDLSPRFTKDVYKVKIPEMSTYPVGAVMNQEVLLSPAIHAEDQDTALNASVRYDIVAGNALDLFWIDPVNGSLFVRRALDREALASERFSLALRASQKDNPARQGTARLEVTILDVNDNAPKFEVEMYNISIVENLPNGFSVLQVAARDADKDENGEFTYELEDPHKAFVIDPNTGWLTVKDQAQLDREKQTSLRMRVKAKEKRASTETGSRSAAIWVTLLDANDNNPAFQPTNVYHFQVNAEAPVGEVIGQVNAIDPDLGRNGQVVYDVQRANSTDELGRPLTLPFSIEAQSGLLLVVDSPLHEDRYTLLVEAADQPANPSERRSALAVATIDVVRSRQSGAASSTGDRVPGFIGAPYEFWVGGNAPVGTTVGLVRLKNIDKKTALYDLLHSYRTGVPFAIEERSGVITVVRELSHFTRTNYEFETVVTDGHFTLVTNVTIHVIDPEDTTLIPTTLQPSRGQLLETFEFRVRENHSGVLVGKLPVPQNKRDTQFLLVNKDLSDLFAVSADGSLYTKKGLDREERSSFHLTIITENRGIVKGEGIYQVVVTVEDENDNPPRFAQKKYIGHISEDAAPNTQVKLDSFIRALDVDMGNNAKFQIRIRGDGSGKFHIDQESGKIFFAAKEPLDREVKPKYNLKLVAVDRGNLSTEVDLTVIVDDVNDNAPNFVQMKLLDDSPADSNPKHRRDTILPLKNMTKSSPIVNVEENIAMGSPVMKIEATDIDEGENAVVTYKIVGEKQREKQDRTNSARHKKERSFNINPSTGEVTVSKRLDPETEFQLDVMAADCCGLSSNMSLTVNVVDVNDHAPTFKRPWYQYDLAEGNYMGWVLGWLHASDADFGDNAQVAYYIDPEEGDLPFSISPEGGALTATGTIDRETGDSYEFRVWAEDSGKPKLKTSVQVTINILDVNDNAPEFYNYNRRDDITDTPIYYTAIDENGPPGQFVLQVFANDSDYTGNGNGLLLYSIAGPPRREFHIDSKDGIITTLTSLDYESANIHNITIVASDLGSPSLSSSAIVLVAVKDHKESTVDTNPIFMERHLEVEVMENSHTPLVLTMLNASSNYRGQALTYSLLPGPDVNHFYVDSRNGTVYLMSAPDREKQSYYVVKVRAEKAKKARHSKPVLVYPMMSDEFGVSGDEVRLVVHVRDENDNTPRFEGALEGRPIVAAIPASASYGDEVVRLHAIDADEGLNGEVRYHMMQKPDEAEPKRFDVHPITGQVRGITSFARDAGKVFGFDVRARDRRGASDGHSVIANVIVYVLDENKQVVLVMNAKPLDVEKNSQNITKALSRLTGLDVRLRKLEPHFEEESDEEADATDLYLYAVDPHLNMVVDMTRLERVLNLHSAALKRDLDIFQAMEVRDLPSTPRAPRPALLAVEAGAVAMGCFVFLGALAAAICFGCVRRRKRLSKHQNACFPASHMGFTMNLRPPYLVELEDATTDSYVDMHSQHSTGRLPRAKTSGGGDLQLSRAASNVARLQRPIASVTSISRHDSGVALHHPHNCSCSSGHETSSSNGSYEDSLKELNPQNNMGYISENCGLNRQQMKKRQREPNSTPPPPPAGPHPHHHVGVHLARRQSERVVLCPHDQHHPSRDPHRTHEC